MQTTKKIIILILFLTFSLYAKEAVNMSFSNLAIGDFIKLVSKVTHKNILVNYKINGTINLISSSPVYDDELIGMLIAVLKSKGYTLAQNDSYYELIRSVDAPKHNMKVIRQGKKPSGSLMVTQAIQLHSENVDVITSKIRYLISKTAKLVTIKESNTLLITDYPKNIQIIKKVISDVETKNNVNVKVIYIKHAEAKKIQAYLSDISKSIFNSKVASDTVKIILDDNINGIIVVGKPKNIKKIQRLVAQLDKESNVSKSIKIFALKNSDATSVLKSLTDIISKQTFADPALRPNVSASEEINSIIAIGDPSIIKGIKIIIDELDKEKYQVYVKARIINIYQKKTEDLGVKYGFDGASVSSGGGLYSLSANFGGASITSAASSLVALPSDLTTAFALGAAIDFLETHGASKSVSNPSILCINNKESSIYVGQTISIATGSISNATAGTNLTNSFSRKDVGLTLKVKPRVSSHDKVTLDVTTILESVDSLGNPRTGEQPVTSKQEVNTQAILRHGESVIIGGLIKNTDKNTVSKIPLLGDIPYLGTSLFSHTSKDNETTNLVVILTPYVIDKSEELSKLQKNLGMVDMAQKEYDKVVFKKLENKKNITKAEPEIDVKHHIKGVY